jgi:putative transposase
MARPLRIQIPDGHYHVTTRGNGGRRIFDDDRDRRTFLHILEDTVERFGWRCLSYCLMTNHVHLVLRTPQPNLARGMQRMKSSYAQAHGRRNGTHGHLFGGRYGAVLVQRDSHLLEVLRYVALNPVRAGLCDRPDEWRWSAHAALAGRAAPLTVLAADEAHELFGGAGAYAEFVSAASAERYDGGAGAVFGTDTFKRTLLPYTRPGTEIALRDWGEGRPPLDEVLDDAGSVLAVAIAYRVHGYTLQDIADALGCHCATVSRRLKAYEDGTFEGKIRPRP